MSKYIIKGRINAGKRQAGTGAWRQVAGLAVYATKKEAQEAAHKLNMRGAGCVEYKVFKE